MSNTSGHYNWPVLATLRDIHQILRGMCESQRLIAIGLGGKHWQVPSGAKCDRHDVLFVDLPPLDFYIFFLWLDLTCSVFLLDVVSKYYCCREKGGPKRDGGNLDMKSID